MTRGRLRVQCAALRATHTVDPARQGLVYARVCRLVHAEMSAPHPATRSTAVSYYDDAQPSSGTARKVRCPACHVQFAFLSTAHVTVPIQHCTPYKPSSCHPLNRSAVSTTLDFWRSFPRVSHVPQIDAPSDNVLSFRWHSFNAKMGPLRAAGFG
jgi:hypothetical protein